MEFDEEFVGIEVGVFLSAVEFLYSFCIGVDSPQLCWTLSKCLWPYILPKRFHDLLMKFRMQKGPCKGFIMRRERKRAFTVKTKP